jgi:hypothetical protein
MVDDADGAARAPEAAPARFNNYGHEWRSQPCMMGIGE